MSNEEKKNNKDKKSKNERKDSNISLNDGGLSQYQEQIKEIAGLGTAQQQGQQTGSSSGVLDDGLSSLPGDAEILAGGTLRVIRNRLADLNIIKEELAKLDINPKLKLQYDFNVFPLLLTLYYLSFTSSNFSESAKGLYDMTFSKTSEIKKAIELVYDLNEISEEVLDRLIKEIKIFIKTCT